MPKTAHLPHLEDRTVVYRAYVKYVSSRSYRVFSKNGEEQRHD